MKNLFWILSALILFGCATDDESSTSTASGFYWRAPNIPGRGQRDAVGTRDEPYLEIDAGSGLVQGCNVSPAGERTDQHRTDTARVSGDTLIFAKKVLSNDLLIVGSDSLKSLSGESDIWIREASLPKACASK